MSIQKKTLELIQHAYNILNEYNPMTLRQVYYQLVAKHIIDNKSSEYHKVGNALVKGRQEGIIPWDWIEDRGRHPRTVNMWQDLPDFIETVKNAYRKDIWESQPAYIEVWLEKEALSGIFTDITSQYGVTLVVGRGYNSWSAYSEASKRFCDIDKPITILYFGDFDPSGEDIFRVLGNSLEFFGSSPKIEKVALTAKDVTEYDLPPDYTKKTDSRSKNFIEKHGDIAVELDALPVKILQQKIRDSIEDHIDLEALEKIRTIENKERQELANLL
jgi:hypothetical protein